tara:strand:+ start:1114 stop:1359 length:246 start_codon:yes stop_codon:yes gene_type:complete
MLEKKKGINVNVLQQTYDIDHEDDFLKKQNVVISAQAQSSKNLQKTSIKQRLIRTLYQSFKKTKIKRLICEHTPLLLPIKH